MGLKELSDRGLINRLDMIERRLMRCSDKERPMWNQLYQSITEELVRRDLEEEEKQRAASA